MIHRNAVLAGALVLVIAACTPSQSAPLPGKRGSMQFSQYEKLGLQKATLAGGCFWGMQELIRQQPGVVATRVGYTGGDVRNATYENHEGHAEAVEILFDPKKTSYENLLLFFFKMHDPTTLNQQGNDRGTSYRSAIFYHDDEQRQVAEKVKARVDKSGAWKAPVVTQIVPAKEFWVAEEEHQDYLQKHPHGYTCHYVRHVSF